MPGVIERLAPGFPPRCEWLVSIHPLNWSTDPELAMVFENKDGRTGYEIAGDTIDQLKAIGHLTGHAHPATRSPSTEEEEAASPHAPLPPKPKPSARQPELPGAFNWSRRAPGDWRRGKPNCGVD